jgi:transcriptional regulator with XRE-family HTH domain
MRKRGFAKTIRSAPATEMGAKIRELRLSHGLTQLVFATAIGVQREVVTNLELGRNDATTMTLLRIGALAEGEMRAWFVERLRERFAAMDLVQVIDVMREVASI